MQHARIVGVAHGYFLAKRGKRAERRKGRGEKKGQLNFFWGVYT